MGFLEALGKQSILLDTSTLIERENIIEELIDVYDICISITTVEELDKLKTDKDGSLAFRARKGIKSLDKYKDAIEFIINNNNRFEQDTNDNRIVSDACNTRSYLMTEDFNLKVKAASLSVPVVEPIVSNQEKYRGYVDISMTEEEQAEALRQDQQKRQAILEEMLTPYAQNMFVTPKEGDAVIDRLADIIANAINIAVHPGITMEDINQYVF